jgi:hypothetical protein
MEKPTRVEELNFFLNTRNIIAGVCVRHSIRASAQVVAYFKEMPTNVAVPVCCAEGCTDDAFSLALERAVDLLAKNQLEVYSEKKWD